MKVLVIPDVHLKPWIFDKADEVPSEKYDTIVSLGDLVDDFNQQHNVDLYIETLERVLKFDSNHPGMLWCWGNHDFSYKYHFTETGFSHMMVPTVGKYLGKMQEQFGDRYKVIHRIDDTLFSHAGLTDDYVYMMWNDGGEVIIPDDIDVVLGDEENGINNFVNSGVSANYLWHDLSPIWTRPQYHVTTTMYKPEQYWQVIGHTPTEEPVDGSNFVSLDTFSTHRDGTPYGNQKLVIVDTVTHTWEYA